MTPPPRLAPVPGGKGLSVHAGQSWGPSHSLSTSFTCSTSDPSPVMSRTLGDPPCAISSPFVFLVTTFPWRLLEEGERGWRGSGRRRKHSMVASAELSSAGARALSCTWSPSAHTCLWLMRCSEQDVRWLQHWVLCPTGSPVVTPEASLLRAPHFRVPWHPCCASCWWLL
jgi:hypothetical protein